MKDVFGKALYNFWQGDRKTQYIVRRDDNYVNSDGLDVYFSQKPNPLEEKALAYSKGNILDVGCGAGRHVLYYQNTQYNIIGVDNSPFAIKTCKERGCQNVQVMNILNSNFEHGQFDTILLFGHNIGIGESIDGCQKLLSVLRKLVSKNGVLLLTSIDVTETKNLYHETYINNNIDNGNAIGKFTIRIEYNNNIGDWFTWIYVDIQNLKKIAKNSGWIVNNVFSNEKGEYSAVLLAN